MIGNVKSPLERARIFYFPGQFGQAPVKCSLPAEKGGDSCRLKLIRQSVIEPQIAKKALNV
jgi:hypothetical protein